jgi:flagellar biosynthetic protein FliQ
MSDAGLLPLLHSALVVALVVALPLLLVSLGSGLLSGMLQTLTNVHDAAAGFAPRLLATAVAALLLMGWMTAKLVDFAARCWGGV